MSPFLLLVEDDFDLSATIVQYLELSGMTCDHAASGEAGLALARKNDYDVLVLDVMLPRISGLEVCKVLRAEGRDTPILMLTARDTLDDKQAGFSSGTDDYLVKPFDMPELVMRIRALARRRSCQARVLSACDITLNLDERQAVRSGRKLTLTPTGWTLLETLVRYSPAVVSREKLVRAIWGDDSPETDSLKVHLHHLRREVNGDDIPLLHTVPGHGYVIGHPDEADV